MTAVRKPIVLITGASGNLGKSLAADLSGEYTIAGLDIKSSEVDFPVFEADFTADSSLELAMRKFRERFGDKIACVIHLVAYFDFSGKHDPRYQSVNVEGTERLLRQLQSFKVQRFVYASTMLVHAPCAPGERIDEQQPIDPRWAYPQSKADAEARIREHHGDIPYAILRLAGVYDGCVTVPTIAQQIARIYERDVKSHLYAGSPLVGQTMLHRKDMLDAFHRTVDRRKTLPNDAEILIGEADAMGYGAVQDKVGCLLFGADSWTTLRVPGAIAEAGAAIQTKLEPAIPDVIDQGEEPFIKPFMIAMADDHYALDTSRANDLLDWQPQHRLEDELPHIVDSLQDDPASWYKANRITAPTWISEASALHRNPEKLRERHEHLRKTEHAANRWAHFINLLLATWLITQPLLIGVAEPMLRWSEIGLGVALALCACAALSWRAQWARWLCAGIGALVMAAPFLFSTANGAAYLSDTLVGALIFGFAICTRPEPGSSALAALTGPRVPPGWTYNPSEWTQRIPIIALAVLGLYVSRYLAAYQLGYIDNVWDPFFAGSALDPQNGSEEIITSSISRAWPVSDAAVGGYTYLLEILTGMVGSRARWRTMPWLVLLFGLMIAPLGIVSISFIIIQPVIIGTWSTIALIGALAVLVQIPYSLDELLATLQFTRRRARAGQNWLRVLLRGDTDKMTKAEHSASESDEFDRSPGAIVKDMLTGGVSLSWNLALAALIGLVLLFTRVLVGAEGIAADTHHVIGSLVLTVISIAAAELARPARYLLIPLGAALLIMPFLLDGSVASAALSVTAGLALIALSIRRGPIRESYGSWDRHIV